jgi:3-oxoisoapionate decarboxylase
MKRRSFLKRASMAGLSLPFLHFPVLAKEMRMGIVVHSYASRWNSDVVSSDFPAFSSALDLIDHCHEIGAGGVQVTVRGWSGDFAKKVRDRRENLELFLEGSISLPKNTDDIDRFEKELVAAKEAGASVVRTVCLSGRRYENFHSLEAFMEFKKNSIVSLELAEPVVRKHRIRLAVENHKDWRAPELVELLKNLDSEWIGATIDFGNNVALLEEPVEVVETLAPYLFTTHVKDMGVVEYEDGFLLSEVPLGLGFVDLKKTFDICRKHLPSVTFNLEMITRDPLKIPCLTDDYWATFPGATPQALARALQMVRQHRYPTTLPGVSALTPEQRLAVEEDNILQSLNYSLTKLQPH